METHIFTYEDLYPQIENEDFKHIKKVDIPTYDSIVSQIKNGDFKHIKKVDGLILHKERVEKFLLLIQSTTEILTESRIDRYVIYKLCEIMNIKYERIDEHGTRIFQCCGFKGPHSDPDKDCGCADVPNKIKKYETGLDYDDKYMQYQVPWTYKRGIRLLK